MTMRQLIGSAAVPSAAHHSLTSTPPPFTVLSPLLDPIKIWSTVVLKSFFAPWYQSIMRLVLCCLCRFLAYLGALAERCAGMPMSKCKTHAYCAVVYPGLSLGDSRIMSHDPPKEWLALKNLSSAQLPAPVCLLDLPRVLSKPCTGSHNDLLLRCGSKVDAVNCGQDSACVWLRSGWWFEPNSKQMATAFSGAEVGLTAMKQAGVPTSFACWPKWHVPYAADKWPFTQWRSDLVSTLPMFCPSVQALDYPCLASMEELLTAYQANSKAPANASKCVDLAIFGGKCSHRDVASWLVAKLSAVKDKLGSKHARGVDVGLCSFIAEFLRRPCDMSEFSYFSPYGAVQLPTQCADVGRLLVVGPDCAFLEKVPSKQRNSLIELSKFADADACLAALVSDGLWQGLADLVLESGKAGTPTSWLPKLAEAHTACGTLSDWQSDCLALNSATSIRMHEPALNRTIHMYEKVFAVDAEGVAAAARAASLVYSCQDSMVKLYRSLAAVWIGYTGVIVFGLLGMLAHWRCCSHVDVQRRLRRAQRAQQLMISSVYAQQAMGRPVSKTTWAQRMLRAVAWVMPRLRGLMFIADIGLDVYTVVQLRSSRWMLHMVVALVTPYTLAALLVFPSLVANNQGDYGHGIVPACVCSGCALPFIWWYDLRMVFDLVGVPFPVCGDSALVLGLYTEVRMVLEGILEAIPSALISTAVLYDNLGLQTALLVIPTAVLWLNLVSSFLRAAWEIWGLAIKSHQKGHCCWVNTFVYMIWDMFSEPLECAVQPSPCCCACTRKQHASRMPTSGPPSGSCVTSAPVQQQLMTSEGCDKSSSFSSSSAHSPAPQATSCTSTNPCSVPAAACRIAAGAGQHVASGGCCFGVENAGRMDRVPWLVLLYVWFWVTFHGVICILTCISIGCLAS